MTEPTVIVNGHRLSDGEVMTIRVALCSFSADLQKPDALGGDETGVAICAGYKKCTRAILEKMAGPVQPQ